MGIFNEFLKKEKPVFTGIARGVGGFGFGGGGGTGVAATELTIEFVLFGAGGSTSRPEPGNGGAGKEEELSQLTKYLQHATLEFRAGGRGVLEPSSPVMLVAVAGLHRFT